jgi:hypothetical protein
MMSLFHFDEGRLLAALSKSKWTAVPETTALRGMQKVRRIARDAAQFLFGMLHANLW